MDKLQFLKTAQQFLRKVITHRRILQREPGRKSHLSTEYVRTATANIEHALATIPSFDRMIAYLNREERTIGYLIPSNKPAWKAELAGLVTIGNNLKAGAWQQKLPLRQAARV